MRNNKPKSTQSHPNPAALQLRLDQCQKDLTAEKQKAQDLSDLLEIASAEAEEFRQRKQTLEDEIRSGAQEIRDTYIESGRQQGEQIQKNAQAEAAHIVVEATAEAAAAHDKLTEREDSVNAREERARQAVEAERVKMLQEAEAEREAILARAHEDAEHQLAKRQSALDEQEQAIREVERAVRRREKEADTLSEDTAFEREQLALRKAQLETRWAQCSPDRVVILEQELAAERTLTSHYHTKVEALQKNNETFRAAAEIGDATTLEGLQRDFQAIAEQFRSLRTVHLQCPSVDEVTWLKEQSAEADRLREDVHALRSRLVEAEGRAGRNEMHTLELQQVRGQKAAMAILNRELRDEINRNAKVLERSQGQRFKKLAELDKKEMDAGQEPREGAAKVANLRQLVDHIRHYAVTKEGLYYDETTIRSFLAGMATSRLAILQGLSGTGKSSLPRILAEAIGARCPRIAVQSNWRDRHELLGYNNDFTGVFSETEFTEAVYEARLQHEKNRIWFIVLDEMNLARIEYYFADFLSALEEPDPQKRLVRLLHFDPAAQGESAPRYLERGALRIPQNVWFIGTANQDQSTQEITDKVYDRGQVIDFSERFHRFEAPKTLETATITAAGIQKAFESAQGTLANQMNDSDREFVRQIDRLLRNELGITFGHRIENQMDSYVPVFVAAGGSKSEAIDYMLARKVLRKTESYYEANLRSTLGQLQDILSRTPNGYGEMTHCLSVLEKRLKLLTGGAA